MNMMLLWESDFIAPEKIRIDGRRAVHIRKILKTKTGGSVKVGKINGLIGEAIIDSDDNNGIELTVNIHTNPPAPLPITLILAMPRPIAFKRMLPAIVSLGIKEIHLFGAQKVEKSYWLSSVFDELDELIGLGLEQAGDTIWPCIELHKRFRPFVEDEIPKIIAGKIALVAHPGSGLVCPAGLAEPSAVCIGPEGGMTDFELEMLLRQGFQAVEIGERILRTEIAVPAIIGRLIHATLKI